MKPFITNASEHGKFILRFQCEGKLREQIEETLLGSSIDSYAMPLTHSFQSAWIFRLYFDNGYCCEFSSSSTELIGWQEVGSLNIRFIKNEDEQEESQNLLPKTYLDTFQVNNIEKLVYNDNDVYSECGLVFRDDQGKEIIIAAGISPGSVSVCASFTTGPFQPEFPVSDYQRISVTAEL